LLDWMCFCDVGRALNDVWSNILENMGLDSHHVKTIVRSSQENRETMVTVFARFTGIGLAKISLEGTKWTSEFFKDHILREIYQGLCASWRVECLARLTLHSDNAPVQNARCVSERSREYRLIRLVHPPYAPDRAPCASFCLVICESNWSNQHRARQMSSRMCSCDDANDRGCGEGDFTRCFWELAKAVGDMNPESWKLLLVSLSWIRREINDLTRGNGRARVLI
jgi:hypothetical protein